MLKASTSYVFVEREEKLKFIIGLDKQNFSA